MIRHRQDNAYIQPYKTFSKMNNDTSSFKENLATGNVAATDSVSAAPGMMDGAAARDNITEAVDPAYVEPDTDPVLSADTAEGVTRAAEAAEIERQAAAATAETESGLPPIATGVNDNMSFSQAFAAARAEVGAGGAFEWHGRVYGTYYKNEWDGMSAQERHDFEVAAIRGSHAETSAHTASAHTASAHADHYVADETVDKYTHDGQSEYTQHNTVQVDTVDDDEVRILGLESVQGEDGSQINIAAIDINGEHAMLVDIDNDQVMDVLVHDDNGDGQISEDEMHNISEYNITVGDIQGSVQSQGATVTADQYASNDIAQVNPSTGYDQDFANNDVDMSDFDNNADVSDFV